VPTKPPPIRPAHGPILDVEIEQVDERSIMVARAPEPRCRYGPIALTRIGRLHVRGASGVHACDMSEPTVVTGAVPDELEVSRTGGASRGPG